MKRFQWLILALLLVVVLSVACVQQWCDPVVQPCRMSADKSTTVMVKWLPAVDQDDEPVTPTGEQPVSDATEAATVEATPEATVIVVETPPVEPPAPSEPAFSFRDIVILGALILLGFSHPPQAGGLWKGLIEQIQKTVKQTPTTADDTALLILQPMLDQIQTRLDAVDLALKSANPPQPPDGTAVG